MLSNPLEMVERNASYSRLGEPCYVEEMKGRDVIVCVNGYPLFKETYDKLIYLKSENLAKQKYNNFVSQKLLDEYRTDCVKIFVAQRLMVDDALRLNIVTTNDVSKKVIESLKANAERKNVSVQEYLESLGERKYFFFYETAVSYVMRELVKVRIPPLLNVDDSFVQDVKKQVSIENASANASNEFCRTRLQSWRGQILEKKIDFGKISSLVSSKSEYSFVGENGFWGEFEVGSMDSPEIERGVFKLPLGGISDVLEDENGFHLVKVLDIKPQQMSLAGKVEVPETRKLAHIYIEKVPVIITQTDAEMFRDLKEQMQTRAVNRYVLNLMTNGANKVEYPHGAKLFK
jgi:hypothetical protein